MTLEQFLTKVEKKAYRMALTAIGDHSEALDIVQDAMTRLVSSYCDKPENELKPLFYRILHNRIMDWHRQQKIKNLVFFWRSDKEENTALEAVAATDFQPEELKSQQEQQRYILAVLESLPVKQQQCFMLRSWEGLSVKETANVMGCSEGSIKTHFFRASQKLKTALEEFND